MNIYEGKGHVKLITVYASSKVFYLASHMCSLYSFTHSRHKKEFSTQTYVVRTLKNRPNAVVPGIQLS